MKHLTLFLVLVMLAVGTTPAFAGKAASSKGNLPTLSQTDQLQPRVRLMDADKAQTNVSKTRAIKPSMATAAPVMNVQKYNLPQLSSGLSGTYQIPSGPLTSLSVAAAMISYFGADGDVTFELINSDYTETSPIIITGNATADGAYKLTIKPATGVTPTVHFVSALAEGKGLVMNGAKNVEVDGLSFDYDATSVFPTNDAFGATIYITGASSNVTIKNGSVKGIIDNAVWANQTDGRPAIFVWAADADVVGSDHLVFDNLTITNATYGFKMLLHDWGVVDYSARYVTINNCKIGGAYGNPVVVGGLYEATVNVTFTNNIIDGVSYMQTYWYNGPSEWDLDGGVFYAPATTSFMFDFGQSTGAHFLIVDGGVFKNNIYRNISTGDCVSGDGVLVYGTRIYTYGYFLPLTAVVTNNIIYGLSDPTGGGWTGIRGPAGNVYHNSISLDGVKPAGATASCINGVTTAYNNAFSNTTTGGTASTIVGITAGGTFNNNAIFSNGRYVSNAATMNAAVAAGVNANGVFGPVGFNSDLTITTGPSSAEDVGRARVAVLTDYAGNPVDTTTAGSRDAGAYQFSTGVAFGPDVMPTGLLSPPAGVPTNVPQTPVVRIKNNSPTAASSVSITLVEGAYTSTKTVSLAKLASADVSFDAWTPTASGPYTFTATSTFAGDVNATNDAITGSTVADPPIALTDPTEFTWETDDAGWTRTADWRRSNSFTKLGGPKSGYSMVTICPGTAAGLAEQYTEGAYASSQGYSTTYPGPNLLMTPWYNLSGWTGSDLYVSFYLSIRLEVLWDRGWMEYTTDGSTWNHLGILNDPNGINWYSEAVYPPAQIDPLNFDYATAVQYGLMPDDQVVDFPSWATAIDENTPAGWVYNRLKVTNPAISRASAIRFRFVAFSDAATSAIPGGWAIDNFYFGSTPQALTPGVIDGTVWADNNGNGLNDDAAPEVGLPVNLYRFGGLRATTVTDALGYYSFGNTYIDLPATYEVEVVKAGSSFSFPVGSDGRENVNYAANGLTLTQNFATYIGSVSGKVLSDIDLDGAKDAGEPGLPGWNVEIHLDSINHALVGTATTDADGEWSMLLGPGNYAATSVNPDPTGNEVSYPEENIRYFTISGNSNSPTSTVEDQDFGYYVKAKLYVFATQDRAGDGVYQGADQVSIPAGTARMYFEVYKGEDLIAVDTLSDGNPSASHLRLDLGTYKVKAISAAPAHWVKTNPETEMTFVVDQSSSNDSAHFLYFHLITVNGTIREDMNGNGVNNSPTDIGLPGVTVTLTGTGGGTMVTDANGYYEFVDVGPGSLTINQTVPAGWTSTGAGATTWSALTADQGGNKNYPYLDFENYCVSGVKFRDRDGDGVKDAGEEGISGWTMNLTGKTAVVTGTDGEFSFCSVGPGELTLAEVAQTGWTATVPTGGTTTFSGTSGTAAVYNFGNFRDGDDKLFRTIALEKFEAAAYPVLKPAIVLVAGKKFDVKKHVPNMNNFLNVIVSGLKVGLVGTKPSNAWFGPVKYTDITGSLSKKGAYHDLGKVNCLANHGFDFTLKGALMKNLWKKVEPGKVNNYLFVQLVTLKANLLLSSNGYLPTGLGALIYTNAGNELDGMTIDEIAAYGDNIMTNWGGVTYATYCNLETVVAQINNAFYDGPTTVIDSAAFHGGTKPWIGGFASVQSTGFLKFDPAVAPVSRELQPTADVVPVVYALNQNYPNPFNPSTTISFDLPQASIVTLKIYNVLGQEVATVLDRQEFDFGTQEADFDASSLASGMYLYRIVAEQLTENGQVGETFTSVKKMMLMK